ncbi:hypothetical protein EVAR_101950_1 [Eumeta japonica]|uniref:Uncharacterized protein n=1 Tax=Eumeta variegata TaxID=151549 RepID=A0A4C1TSF8_EUMVA|nr:hypothetical protein EVAR_101950_1 [Eumeta japonica]
MVHSIKERAPYKSAYYDRYYGTLHCAGPDTDLSSSVAALGVGDDGLAPEGASQTKKFCLQVIKKRPRKKFCLQVIKKRPRKPDVADVHEWCSAATGRVIRI